MEDIDWIDYDEIEETNKKEKLDYKIVYNDQTEFYKTMRLKKYNVISHDAFDCNEEHLFKFNQMWDPYTGERLENDPFGSLYFHPDDLIYFYYKRRLKMLWYEPNDEIHGGYYQGYYGDAVGSGQTINIPGRGIYPELYLFRLPIDDCYMLPDSDLSIITMGPILTNDEVYAIDMLANTYHSNNYESLYGKKRPSLFKMKLLYDNAISQNPNLGEYDLGLKKQEMIDLKNKLNRESVDALVKFV
jgi:hypothetical protein